MRIVSAQEAVAGIRSGDTIYLHGQAATPSTLLQALVDRAPELTGVTVAHLHAEGPAPHLAPEMAPHFRHRALFIGPNARAAVNEGRADYVPIFLSDKTVKNYVSSILSKLNLERRAQAAAFVAKHRIDRGG